MAAKLYIDTDKQQIVGCTGLSLLYFNILFYNRSPSVHFYQIQLDHTILCPHFNMNENRTAECQRYLY